MGWRLWDCRLMRSPKGVVWVDDVTARYAQPTKWPALVESQAERILILSQSRLILIDPIDEEIEATTRMLEATL